MYTSKFNLKIYIYISIGNIAIYEPRSAFGMNYCEIRCKYADDCNTAHVMIHQNWNDSLNYQMLQSINVLKDVIDVRDCVKECAILDMEKYVQFYNIKFKMPKSQLL